MTVEQNSTPNQNDKIMAALGHISALLPLLGLIAPIIIWATQKEKSKYVSFQALQAIAYQLIIIFAYFLATGCYMISFFSTFLTIPFADQGSDPSSSPIFMIAFLMPFLVFGMMFIGGALFIVYGIVGAIFTIQGKDFQYIFIGKRVEKFLESEN